MTINTLQPTPPSKRIDSLDIIRGVALLGILLMNIAGMGLSHAYSDPTVSGGASGFNLTAWWTTSLLFEGTMRSLFSMLFGAGIILFTSRQVEDINGVSVTDAFFRRVTWLVLFGMIHAYLLLWIGDILFAYGLVAFFVYSFRKLKPGHLLLVSLAAFCCLFCIYLYDYTDARASSAAYVEAKDRELAGIELTEENKTAIERWDAVLAEMKPPSEVVQKDIESRQKGYFSVVASQAKVAQFLESTIMYRYFFLDIFAMMILGMALFKYKVLQASKSRKFYFTIMLIGYAVGLTTNYLETSYIVRNNFELVAIFRSLLSYDVGRVAMALGHLGLIVLFIKSGILPWLQRSLAAVGRMALSNYISHTLITTSFFILFKRFGTLERYELYFIVAAIWVFQLIVSPIWLRYFKFGPIEWLWRSLTYWQKQPFMKPGKKVVAA